MIHSLSESGRIRRHHETRQRIIASARQLVEAEGFQALSMHRVAAALAYTVGALYRYFPNKDALILALLGEAAEILHDELDEAQGRVRAYARRQQSFSAHDEVLLQILVGAVTYRALPERRPAMFEALSIRIADPKGVQGDDEVRAITPALAKPVQVWSRHFERAAELGVLQPGDSGHRTVALWSAVHGTMLMEKFAGLGLAAFDSKRLASSVSQTLLVGWGADTKQVKAMSDRAERLIRARTTRVIAN